MCPIKLFTIGVKCECELSDQTDLSHEESDRTINRSCCVKKSELSDQTDPSHDESDSCVIGIFMCPIGLFMICIK